MPIVENLSVPYVAQTDEDGCGAAALEMVLRYLKYTNVNQVEVFKRLREKDTINKGHHVVSVGSLLSEAKKLGFLPYARPIPISRNEEMLDTIGWFVVGKKLPLIAAQHFSALSTFIHYRVIVGIEQDAVIAHDPAQGAEGGEAKRYDASTFAALWCKRDQLSESGVSICVSDVKLQDLDALPGLGGASITQ